MVVGSPFEDVVHEGATIPEAGAVYVYRREGQGWSEFARLQSIAPGSGDQYGASVAMDFGRLIVGAPGEDGEGVLDLADINENAPDCGAAYTYSLRDSGVEFDRYLKPDNAIPRKTKGFGEAVAVDGGLFVVGAPNEGTRVDSTLGVVPAPNAGAVYLFSIQGSATPLQRIEATDAAANQGFGSALGFDAFGVAPVEVDVRADYFKKWIADGMHGDMAWLARNPERRTDARKVMPEARSLVVVGLNYYQPHPPAGYRIAKYALGADYHDVLLARLQQLCEAMKELGGEQKPYVDTGPVLEKPVAAAVVHAPWQGQP